MATTVQPAEELIAPSDWRTVDFISDLHLQAGDQATFAAWQHYMQTSPADAIFILGDLFEVWIGDDAVDPGDDSADGLNSSFEGRCAAILRGTATASSVFFMHGNRDFLVGQSLMQTCNVRLLPDPLVLVFNQQRWLLSHGDALCLDDVDYMAFRQLVRSDAWQTSFLAKPLAERQEIARHIRQQSEARKQPGARYADLDATATREWLLANHAATMIHGHTHQPALHDLGDQLQRVVLSDWEMLAHPPRAEVLRMTTAGLQRLRLT